MKNFRTNLLATAVLGALTVLSGCGGGGAEKEVSSNAGTGGTAYSLSNSVGLYGASLQKMGWEFSKTALNDIPNAADTILYINASDPGTRAVDLADFVSKFQGVLVVDSNDVREIPQAAPVADQATNAIAPSTQVAGPVGQFYLDLKSGKTAAPNGSALVVAQRGKSLTPLAIAADGGINGFSAEAFEKDFGLRVSADSNLLRSGKPQNSDKLVAQGSITDGVDVTVNLISRQDDWVAIGIMSVTTFKISYGSGYDYYIYADVTTGNGSEGCLVNNTRCGIYPAALVDISKATVVPNTGNTQVDIVSYGVGYNAGITASPVHATDPIKFYQPTAASWASTDAEDKDYVDQTTSSGFSIGGSWTIGSWFPSSSVSLSRSVSRPKRVNSWKGVEQLLWTQAFNLYYVSSGISMLDTKMAATLVCTGPWQNDSTFEGQYRKNLIDGNDIDQIAFRKLPDHSWKGYRPGINATFKMQAPPASQPLGKQYAVTGRLSWLRATARYKLGAAFNGCTKGAWYRQNAGYQEPDITKSYTAYTPDVIVKSDSFQ